MGLLNTERFPFDGLTVYRNCAQGRMAASWSDRLEGMAVSLDAPELAVRLLVRQADAGRYGLTFGR
jgi:hypothetical protein